MKDNIAYCEHLFDETTDGYISLIEIGSEALGVQKVIKVYNTQLKSLKTIVEEIEGREDTYISPNTYFVPKRSGSNIRQYRSLFIDLDVEKYGKHSKEETMTHIADLVNQNKIPEPSMIADSGRGFHLYFRIKNAPKQAIQTFQELEDYLYYQLKELGADLSATDSARVLRLPGTINSRNKATCKIVSINRDLEYSMYELRDQYLNYKENKQKKIIKTQEVKIKKEFIVRNIYNSYSLHITRAEDITTLCKLRGYDVEGFRNFILHCFSYWTGIYVRDQDQLIQEVAAFNETFKSSLPDSEVKGVCKSINKAIEKFIDYEQGVRSGLIKRVTKGMRDKSGYWYTNKTLIRRLQITELEQRSMKTIIDPSEKYRRKVVKRDASRRNDEGLTAREQAKQERINEVMKLKELKLNQSEIARKLSISRQAVSKIIKNLQCVN